MSENINYLAATLVGECRGEPIEGQVAVANVIMNRFRAALLSPDKTQPVIGVKDICLAPKQFSCWEENDMNFDLVREILSKLENGNEIKDPIIRQCIAVARAVFNEDFIDNTKGAKNYVTIQRHQLAKARQAKMDNWILKMKPSVVIGKHIFLVNPTKDFEKVMENRSV